MHDAFAENKRAPSSMMAALHESSTSALLGARRPPAQELCRTRSHEMDHTTVSNSCETTQRTTLTRTISFLFGMRPVQETFLCHICFENVPLATALELSGCGHRFCQSCFKSYLELKIREGNVSPACFHPVSQDKKTNDGDTKAATACGVRVLPTQIQRVVDRAVFAKYELFRFNQEHATARECPYCSHAQVCGPGAGAAAVCQCVACANTFCFFHGNAHEQGSCADFELKHAQTESLSRAAITRVSKPCPGCSNNVEKAGGCNSMICIVCKTSFCWICDTLFPDEDSRSMHFRILSFSYCGGMMLTDVGVGIHSRQPWWWRLNTAVDYGLRVGFVSVLEAASVLVYPVAYITALLLAFIARLFKWTVTELDFSDLVAGMRFFFATLVASHAIFFLPALVLPHQVVLAAAMFILAKILMAGMWMLAGPSVMAACSFVVLRVRALA